MKTDKFGVPRFSSTDIFDALYQGKIDAVADMLCESCEEIQKFNKSAEELGTDKIRVCTNLLIVVWKILITHCNQNGSCQLNIKILMCYNSAWIGVIQTKREIASVMNTEDLNNVTW